MASDILGTSLSGLRVSQNALRTTGHNIANADTAGFSRQRIESHTLGGTYNGNYTVGNGAYTATVERIANEFITGQVRSDTSLYNELSAFNDNALQVNTILSNEITGLTNGLESFFAATQNATDDPTSSASRQLMINESGNIVDRFNILHERFQSVNDGVNESLSVAVSTINNLSENIALLNIRISEAGGADENSSPNDLLDQRDEALRELSELVSINASYQGNGQVNVSIGDGQTLVLGSESRRLSVVQDEFDPNKSDIIYTNPNENSIQPITDSLSGGEIGGLIKFQSTMLDQAVNEMGRIALVMADNFNQQQQKGIDLNGQFGNNLFTDINAPDVASDRVLPSGNNTSSGQVMALNIIDTQQVTTSDYVLSVNESRNLYQVTRLDDGVVVSDGVMPVERPASIAFDGLEFTIASGDIHLGDKFLFKPTALAARDINSELTNPEDLALGSPVLTGSTSGNLGNAVISPGDVLGLVDSSAQPLPLFANQGEMSPPFLVRFTSDTTYDILDNSNPGKPVQLDPPLRNLTYVPGVTNNLFPEDINQQTITTKGTVIGIPLGKTAASQASLQPASPPAAIPNFATTDFSGATNQFSFDIVVSGTPGAINDGTFSVTIDSPGVIDNTTLLAEINNNLAGSNVQAYITDGGTVGFSYADTGYADISVQNYNADPDGGGNNAPAGQANTLLGFDVEGSSFTTISNADGTSGRGIVSNGYPSEGLTFLRTHPQTGAVSSQNIFTRPGASAKETASLLNDIDGVSANARNAIEISDLNVSGNEPLQIQLNGENLLEYTIDSSGNSVLSANVPDPTLNNGEDFNDYLAQQINANTRLAAAGIHASSNFNATNNDFVLQINSTQGDDFTVNLTAAAGESLFVGDGTNPSVALSGNGNSVGSEIVVGGNIDISLDDGLSLSTLPPDSLLFGDSTASDFATSSYWGIQANITGTPEAGDSFTINFNTDAALDNRNGLAMVGLQQADTLDNGGLSYSDAYNRLIEEVGIKTNSSKINTEAAQKVLEQSTELRNSISGVNLDEEAANLIKFEQFYAANTQVINVARELFNRLLDSL